MSSSNVAVAARHRKEEARQWAALMARRLWSGGGAARKPWLFPSQAVRLLLLFFSLHSSFVKLEFLYGKIMQMKKSFWICFNQVS